MKTYKVLLFFVFLLKAGSVMALYESYQEPDTRSRSAQRQVFFSLPRVVWQLQVLQVNFPGVSIYNSHLIPMLLQIEELRAAIQFYEDGRSQLYDSDDESDSEDSGDYEGPEEDVNSREGFNIDGASCFWDFFLKYNSNCLIFNLPNRFGMYPIHEVVRYRQSDLMSPVLDITYDIYVKSFDGLTAFHYAARDGFLPFFQGWTEGSVDFNVKDSRGRTPLWHAIECNQQEVVDFLIAHGGNE
ncbi:ankyrin repeat domain-containing protein [Candidatus Babeliales bacterium]|nr:ankyrin repeat domain-containing protein [Candidatus Babeliales bacterium]